MILQQILTRTKLPFSTISCLAACFNRQCPPLTSTDLGCSDDGLDPFGFPQDHLCSEDSVAELLVSLDPSKSSGVDGISAKMLCLTASSIASSLTNLFNLSLNSCLSKKRQDTTYVLILYQTSSRVWDPILKKDIELIENIQNFTLKVCTKSWDANYSSSLETSGLPSLESRKVSAKLCSLYKIINGLTFCPGAPVQDRVLCYSSRTVHSRAIVPSSVIRCSTKLLF